MSSHAALRWAGSAWFVVAVAGQLIFAAYVALLYGRATLAGDWSGWNKAMPHGYVPGDAAGNTAVGLHLFWAFVILTTGAVQLLPWMRRRAPAVHRWSGRVYLMSAVVTSVAGLHMVWTRGTVGGWSMHLSISLNALVILGCAGMAWRQAAARRFGEHRKWALRLFLVASGVWFFRVGLMLWLAIHRAPVGFDPKTFQGPFLTFLGFGQYLIPLLVLELYFRAEKGGNGTRLAMASAMAVFTLMTAGGIASAAMGMWWPRL